MLWIILITAAVALIATALLGFAAVPMLRKLKFGQTILDIGPAWHKKTKQGTPTMGGVFFIPGVAAAFAAGIGMLAATGRISLEQTEAMNYINAVSGLIMALLFGAIGFIDDFTKIRRKQNEGLTPSQKIVLQVLVIAAYFTVRILAGNTSTVVRLPFIGALDLWYFYYILVGLAILYLVNAVNLTDGIDGLCTSVTFVYCAAFIVITAMLNAVGLTILAAAAAGGCIGFLIWNAHPAKVFMGDTGSLFFGGVVVALGIGANAEVLMVIAAAVYIWEALTVLIQTTYFKITHGKRLFKMTPIHHSFEMRGWKEGKIVAVFSLLGLLAGAVAVLLAKGL
ncbi:MAG: phospho-N-acetylmuramoyl-pentapeptide-transferase [Bacteroides sp.]|nr:phospho-N-acetylmuramoyl-pentapeptide-transferase [Eubacterium sp.]MCM1418326.1 phospho-N-acetylmuramoyl-pentapeptide-transferase [Roseburia sp.]MCM1463391.1 phospho-N-acetylmuramoyl-pentapeptide-transferase [Bacteroides sp.]